MDVPELTTQHLSLRGWRPDDLDAFAAIMADPEVTRYLDGPLGREEAAELLDGFVGEWTKDGFGRWAVADVATGALIGQCGFRRYDRGIGDFTVVIARAYQQRGLGSEAARRALRYGFEHLGFRRVRAVVHPANRPAVRILEDLGMTHTEDTLRARGQRMMVFVVTELERRMRSR